MDVCDSLIKWASILDTVGVITVTWNRMWKLVV